MSAKVRHFTFEERKGRGASDCVKIDAIDPTTGERRHQVEITVSPKAHSVTVYVDGEPYYIALDR